MEYYYVKLVRMKIGVLTMEPADEEARLFSSICFFSALTDAPAYVIQVVSEVYDADFWELWERVKDVAKRKRILYQLEIPQETISVSTVDFLGGGFKR